MLQRWWYEERETKHDKKVIVSLEYVLVLSSEATTVERTGAAGLMTAVGSAGRADDELPLEDAAGWSFARRFKRIYQRKTMCKLAPAFEQQSTVEERLPCPDHLLE